MTIRKVIFHQMAFMMKVCNSYLEEKPVDIQVFSLIMPGFFSLIRGT